MFGPGTVPVLPRMQWLSGTISQDKMSSERLFGKTELKGECNCRVIHPYTVKINLGKRLITCHKSMLLYIYFTFTSPYEIPNKISATANSSIFR